MQMESLRKYQVHHLQAASTPRCQYCHTCAYSKGTVVDVLI
ncbi:hypothetical protein NC652_027303 [Populus alba x Populus x berolinensis]|nr:hypothetical protein NC652_027303 [Populus alba x Populus x berolinensis]